MRNYLLLINIIISFIFVLPLSPFILSAEEEEMQGLGESMEFVLVEGSCFEMGDAFRDGKSDEKPVHKACIDDFYIGKTEVTQKQWKDIMGSNPSYFKSGDNYPVESVSWNDVQEFIEKLNNIEQGLYIPTDQKFRLPTEAEWEYAARSGGKEELFAGFSKEEKIYIYANFCDVNCKCEWKTGGQDDGYEYTSPVGSYRPNSLGIYDMTGNVWECLQDWYGENYYKNSPIHNPKGPSDGSFRVYRGGGWNSEPESLRASNRNSYPPAGKLFNLGFRLARTP